MTVEELEQFAFDMRKLKTSTLVIMLDTDALVDALRACDHDMEMTADDLCAIVSKIADELDRRIPVPA
jgi:hypothetical protein